jgi:environmental stress-induced protein Ves
MQVVRYASLSPTPWKNGGGVTHEVMRVPAVGDPFRWRVSVAEIAAAGPFSHFAGYRRTMVLLRGAGVRLTFDGSDSAELEEVGDLVQFDGARSTHCELPRGPCVDLNLMVAASMRGAHAWVERLWSPRPVSQSGATTLAFAITGLVNVESGGGEAGAGRADGGEAARLHAWDLAVFAPREGGVVEPAALDPSVAPLVFFATLDDNAA